MNEPHRARGPSLPALLRAARRIYGVAIRQELAESGYDDIPESGLVVIGAITRSAAPLGELIQGLGVSKQVAGQLVDTLVRRGYVLREMDAEDRRRFTIALSQRGRAVAKVMRTVIERIDAQLCRRVGAEAIACTRATLQALIELPRAHHDDGDSR